MDAASPPVQSRPRRLVSGEQCSTWSERGAAAWSGELGRGLGPLLGGSESGCRSRTRAGDRAQIGFAPIISLGGSSTDPQDLENLRASIQQLSACSNRSTCAGTGTFSRSSRASAEHTGGSTCRQVDDPRPHPWGRGDHGRGDAQARLVARTFSARTSQSPRESTGITRDLMTRLGLSQEQVAERVGVKRSTVANHLRLLELPETGCGARSSRSRHDGSCQGAPRVARFSRHGTRPRESRSRGACPCTPGGRLASPRKRSSRPGHALPGEESSRIPPWVSRLRQRLRDGGSEREGPDRESARLPRPDRRGVLLQGGARTTAGMPRSALPV